MSLSLSRITKANYISLARLFVLTPASVTFVLLEYWYVALFMLVVSGASDHLDGIIARREATVSNFGVFLDLTADKTFVIAMFVCFLHQGLVPLWAVLVIVLRELMVTGLRCYAAAENIVIKPAPMGGWKIIITFVAMFAVVLHLDIAPHLVIGTAFLTALSGIMYFYNARTLLTKYLYYPQ
ncbi:MAG: CDP-alcohol phosphatidyltransferase family protein [Micropepsaceae bacterium]